MCSQSSRKSANEIYVDEKLCIESAKTLCEIVEHITSPISYMYTCMRSKSSRCSKLCKATFGRCNSGNFWLPLQAKCQELKPFI